MRPARFPAKHSCPHRATGSRSSRIGKTALVTWPRSQLVGATGYPNARGYIPFSRLGLGGLWRRFPALNGANLHDFRKACKQLRYLAEAHGTGVEQAVLAEALHRVQDAIGAWHDFSELQQRARDSKVAGGALQAAIDNAVASHYATALHSAERLRKAPMGHAGPMAVNASARASA